METDEESRLSGSPREDVPDGNGLLGVLGIAVGLFCMVTAVAAPKPRFEPGQRWQYRHEGPRPGSDAPNAIDGERILLVTASDEEQGGGQWVIEERFTNDEKTTSRLYVDGSGLLTGGEIQNEKGQRVGFRYDPPVPYRPADMNVGEIKTIQATVRMDSVGFALPNKTVVERLPDEAVSTPAGEFGGCTHFKSTTTSTVDIRIAKIAMSEEREQWYHPSVNGMVKEVYRKDPVSFLGRSRPGYTATSTLMAYGQAAVDADGGLLRQSGVGHGEQQEPSRSPPRQTWFSAHGLILAGLGTLAIGAFVLARRASKKE
jgi:hypothetical protein